MVDKDTHNDDEFLADLAELIEYYAPAEGMAREAATNLANVITSQVRQKYAGGRLYIRKKCKEEYLLLAEKVRTEFDGANLAEIMDRYQIGRTTVYRYLAEKRSAEK